MRPSENWPVATPCYYSWITVACSYPVPEVVPDALGLQGGRILGKMEFLGCAWALLLEVGV